VASEKYLAVTGIGEEDTAHLRLLLRMAVAQLEHRWRWGTEENADLVIVDPAALPGQIARNRAFSGGRRCAVFSDSEPLRDGELRLVRPLKTESLVAILNDTTATTVALNATVTQQNDDFYNLGTLTPEFEFEDDAAAGARSHQRDSAPAPSLEELLHPDTASAKPMFAVPMQLGARTSIERAHGPSMRSDKRIADSADAFRKLQKQEDINLGSPIKHAAAPDPGKHGLRDYLRGNLLGGPASIHFDAVPELTLDPKEKIFHTSGNVRALSAYCTGDLPHSAWRPVMTHELARLRAEQSGQPYSRLIWLDALLRSSGRLASHLDPGGRYKLKRQQQTETDFPSHARIIAALAAPAKLNEIATASGASMAEVFDVVNAYDAIGLIDVEPRLPRHVAPEPRGLLARLRKPFGKS
jgi:hypothetical protein